MRATRIPSLALAAVLLAAAPASAAPALSTPTTCMVPDGDVPVTGAGFSAGGLAELTINRSGAVAETATATADAAGAFSQTIKAPELAAGARRETLQIQGTDVNTGAVATTTFQLTTVDVTVPQWDRKKFPRTVTVKAIGWVYDTTLYAHFVRRRKVLKTVRLGALRGACSDLTARMRVPRVGPGKLVVAFNGRKKYSRRDYAITYSGHLR